MMFKEDETQYCPMCQEWAEKYEKLKQALEEIREITEQDRGCINSELACCRLCEKLDLIKEKINEVLHVENN